MSFSLDTVKVDPGDEKLYLNWGIYQSFSSTDRRYLYNFNQVDNTLEKIDLNVLRLEKRYDLKKRDQLELVRELMQFSQ